MIQFAYRFDCDVTTTTVENVKNSTGGLPLLTAGVINGCAVITVMICNTYVHM